MVTKGKDRLTTNPVAPLGVGPPHPEFIIITYLVSLSMYLRFSPKRMSFLKTCIILIRVLYVLRSICKRNQKPFIMKQMKFLFFSSIIWFCSIEISHFLKFVVLSFVSVKEEHHHKIKLIFSWGVRDQYCQSCKNRMGEVLCIVELCQARHVIMSCVPS